MGVGEARLEAPARARVDKDAQLGEASARLQRGFGEALATCSNRLPTLRQHLGDASATFHFRFRFAALFFIFLGFHFRFSL